MDRIWFNDTEVTRIYPDWPTPKIEDFFSFDTGYSSSDRFVDLEGFTKEQADVYVAGILAGELQKTQIDQAQTAVDIKLAETLYDLTSFIEDRFDLTQAEVDQISVMTTVPQLRAVILDRFQLSAGQKAYIQNFRDAYEAWLATL